MSIEGINTCQPRFYFLTCLKALPEGLLGVSSHPPYWDEAQIPQVPCGKTAFTGSSLASVTPAHLPSLPAGPRLSLAGLQLFPCSWKTGDRFSWPWLQQTLKARVIKPLPAVSTNEHPALQRRNWYSSLAAQPRTSVWQAGALQSNTTGNRSSWQTCSLSFSIFHSSWRPGKSSCLELSVTHFSDNFCEKETDCKWWMRWAVTAQKGVSQGRRMWAGVKSGGWRGSSSLLNSDPV